MDTHPSLNRPLNATLRSRLRRRSDTRSAVAAPRWHRYSLVALLVATAVLYLWGLGASGWANGFYAAAVEAGAKSWKAFLFGSFDSSNFITVDKPPASLWVMDLSARVFGVNAWSILVPQALEGVAAVALLYATVRRGFGHSAGLIAGATMALTPVAALMFRFDNPDALLVLLLVGATYATLRAVESGRTWLLVVAGTLVGFGFLTKMMQAFIILPVFAAVYLLAGPTTVRRRLLQLVAAGVAVVVSAGWWVTLVSLWPAADRPYIGGSTDNSILDLIFGYNGFGRITGSETGSVGGTGTAGGWGPTGWNRLFTADFGGQVSWLIPAALVLFGASLIARRHFVRTDMQRAASLMWGGWLILTGLVFSYAQGIIHPYYSVALAPAIAALVGMGAVAMWRLRSTLFARLVLSATVAATAAWAIVLLGRSPTWLPWLTPVLAVVAVVAIVGLMLSHRLGRPLLIALAATALAVCLAAPLSYTVDTATPHGGAIPSAGPAVQGATAFGGPPGGGAGGAGTGPPLAALGGTSPPANGGAPALPPGVAPPTTRSAGAAGGAGGGLLTTATPSAAVTSALAADAASYTWVAGTVGADSAAGYQLATGDAVMAIGGFNGTDPTPTLALFERLVAEHQIHYFIASGGLGGAGGSSQSASSAITAWVAQHFSSSTVGGTTLYDLTQSSGA